MTRYLLILALSGCATYQPDPCNENPAGLKRYCGGEARESKRPEIEPPDPSPGPEEVCDGGARKCGDGEQPTGTVDDPTGYM